MTRTVLPSFAAARMDIPALPYCWTRLQAETPISGVAESPTTLGERIRNERLRRRLLQREIADLLGVTGSTVNNWERGRTEPAPNVLPRVLEMLTRPRGQ